LGIKASGRTLHQALDLDRNYRNTQEILKLASNFSSKTVTNNEDSINIIPVHPNQATRKGPKPILIHCKDRQDECERIINIVKILLEGRIPYNDIQMKVLPEEIGILYRTKPYGNNQTVKDFVKELSRIAPVTWLSEDYLSRVKVSEPGIKVQTVDSSKGLQYRVVFILWTDLFGSIKQVDEDLERRRLYVALTRAEDVLIITYSKPNAFIDMMIESGDVDNKLTS
jgi:superfamily I DNA/RNA helicase